LPGKRAWPVPRGRRRSNAPPLPDWRIWYYLAEAAGLAVLGYQDFDKGLEFWG